MTLQDADDTSQGNSSPRKRPAQNGSFHHKLVRRMSLQASAGPNRKKPTIEKPEEKLDPADYVFQKPVSIERHAYMVRRGGSTNDAGLQ